MSALLGRSLDAGLVAACVDGELSLAKEPWPSSDVCSIKLELLGSLSAVTCGGDCIAARACKGATVQEYSMGSILPVRKQCFCSNMA